MKLFSGGRETTATDSDLPTRCATVMLFFLDSCMGAFMVTEIYILGISDVVKENGQTTSRENNNMWENNNFISSPEQLPNYLG